MRLLTFSSAPFLSSNYSFLRILFPNNANERSSREREASKGPWTSRPCDQGSVSWRWISLIVVYLLSLDPTLPALRTLPTLPPPAASPPPRWFICIPTGTVLKHGQMSDYTSSSPNGPNNVQVRFRLP